MKKQILIPILTGVLFAVAANAQEDITITGSTAARKIVQNRVAVLFDAGFVEQGGTLAAGSASTITVSGTMSNAIPSLGSTPVVMRFALSGSAQGISDLNAGTLLNTKNPTNGTTETRSAIIAFADNWPEANTPALSSSLFTANTNLCVLPFVFFKNSGPGMANVTNLTKEEAIMLMTSSGTVAGFPAMQPDFLGGTTNGGPVYLFGRDGGSGTRIGVHKDIGFTGSPRNWATNSAGTLVLATATAGSNGVATAFGGSGYSSGGTLCKVVASPSLSGNNLIGYAGESDATSGNGITPANWLSYNGVFPTHSEVANGRYAIWCYEHAYAKAGTLNANQQAVFNALVAAVSDSSFQSTNTTFTGAAVALSEMKVKRGVDGGSFTTTPTAGF